MAHQRRPKPDGRWKRRGAAVATGLVLAASRPGFDFGWLAFVGLVPLLWALKGVRPRVAFSLGLIAGFVYYAIVVSWAWYFGAIAIVPFAGVLALYWGGACALIALMNPRGWLRPFAIASAWVVGEAAVSRWPLGGFSWGELGYAMHNIPPMRSLAALGGVALVSFVVVLINALIAETMGAPLAAVLRGSSILGVVVVGTAVWFAAWPRLESSGTMRIAMLQGNDINRDLTPQEMAAFTLPLRHFALADQLTGRYDLIVFPESAFHPEYVNDPRITERLISYARQHSAVVLGNGVAEAGNGKVFNRNVLYDGTGRLLGTYEKRHLVPFGEWVPWRAELQSLISELKRIPRDFTPGHQRGIFTIASHRIATVICFESAFGPLVRDRAEQGAELIVVSTNNRSYRRSANSEQHVALDQLRAAETGRSVLHASVSGITAVIDDRGRITRSTQLFHNEAVTTMAVTRHGATVYMRIGDSFALLCGACVGVGILVGWWRRRRGPSLG